MSHERDRAHPTDAFGLPEGLLAAISGALLLVVVFAVETATTPMPPAERWAALTTFTLLAVGATLPGCAALYDALGAVVRRDWRALAVLAALVPVLYAAYALAVRELTPGGLGSALLFAAVPTLAFGLARGSRRPTPFDAVALGYLIASLALGLLPRLMLPQQGGLVPFFQFSTVPLLLLLYAGRGWPGLGFTWHLSGPELRAALLAAIPAILVMALAGLLGNEVAIGRPGAGVLLVGALGAYFFGALPAELLLRGGVQRGLERALADTMGAPLAAWVALGATAALSALVGLALGAGNPYSTLQGGLIGLAAGWAYRRTGKLTASAVTHMLIVWSVSILAGGV
ncbi:MAG: hypothetical protein OHK0015_32590 [Chloroflexi bacterium OHK40]